MTEEEIRPIAENYVEEYCHCSDGEYTDGSLICAGIGTALIVSRQLEKRIVELEEENAQLKDKNKALEQYADLADAKVDEVKNKLTEESGIIKDYMFVADNTTVCSVPEENRCINVLKLNEKAKQFLRDVDRW